MCTAGSLTVKTVESVGCAIVGRICFGRGRGCKGGGREIASDDDDEASHVYSCPSCQNFALEVLLNHLNS